MKNQKTQTITLTAAAQIAKHLVAVINDPHIPENRAQKICNSLNEQFNNIGAANQRKLTYGNVEYVKNLLLAASGNADAIETGEMERHHAGSTMNRELYAVIEDKDTTGTLANPN